MNKRGEDLSYETVVFLLIVLAFFAIIMVFVYKSAYGSAIYEQTYAKQIGLMIDGSKPGMTISVDMGKIVDLSKSKKEKAYIFRINNEAKEISVSSSEKGGYSFQYFSGYNVSILRQPSVEPEARELVLKIGDENG